MAERELLKVPDALRLRSVQQLCELEHPYGGGAEADALFVRAMREITEWHADRSPFYRALMDLRRVRSSGIDSVEACYGIPLVPAEFFKQHEVLSIPRDRIFLHVTSSGTTGQKSQIFFDEWSIKAAQRMIDRIFDYYGWTTPGTPTNYLLYSYETEPSSKLGTAYTDNFLCKYAPIARGFCGLRRTGAGAHDFDVFGCIEKFREYAADGKPVRIFGFPAFLYFTLQRMRDLKIAPLRLSPASFVFLGGGWKGHAEKAIKKQELYAMVTEQLGIPDVRIRDGFGSVEHCVPYIECDHHNFHVPVWSRVVIRDVRTLAPLGYGQPGFLHFISPYITSVPAHSVMMGDLASLYAPESCACGLKAPYFVVHGRAGTSKNKSCAIAAAELLKGRSS